MYAAFGNKQVKRTGPIHTSMHISSEIRPTVSSIFGYLLRTGTFRTIHASIIRYT